MSQMLILAQQGDGSSAFAVGGVLMIVLILIGLLAAAFWIWMMIDALTSNRTPAERVVWFLVIFLFPMVGALIYFFVIRSGRRSLTT